MIRCSGKSVLKGIAIGRIYVHARQEEIPVQREITDIYLERIRFLDAVEEARNQLDVLYQSALESVGKEQADIFEVHRLMLADEDFLKDIAAMIEEENDAAYATFQVGNRYSQMFGEMNDEYMKARSADVLDISHRVIRILTGAADDAIKSDKPVIILAEDLTPSETIRMDKSKILGFVTRKGALSSHTSILARSMNLPSLVNTDIELIEKYHGKMAVIDGFNGELIIEPDEALLNEMVKKKNDWLGRTESLKEFIGQDNITTDGRRINIYCNIGSIGDVDRVLESDGGGIGLFRSEFLYLGRDSFPTEDEQFESYKTVIERMKGKKVIIRTLDIGADKKADYFGLDKEENPALGYRAIRICLDRTDVFKTQLRAIYRASAFGKTSVMFPMIVSVEEIRKIKEIVEEVKRELIQQKIAMGEVELGIMIETPAAALISDELAKEVGFFSIGTNDLSQYTLAMDRQNEKLDGSFDFHHRAILKLIQMSVENGHREKIWVGICGELAADVSLTKTFVDMGVDELSVSPSCVLELRKTVRAI